MRKQKNIGFKKGGFKNKKTRPAGYSRSGLPKIFPPSINMHLRAVKLG